MKLMILDGNSVANRAFYGVRTLTAPDGTPTNAVYGFLSLLHKLLETHAPEALCVAFDLSAPTFRHLRYDSYKATRKKMPEELAVQLPLIKQALDAMGVLRLELEGYEADDLIGTVSRLCEQGGTECLIVTGDRDSFQLISETTHVLHMRTRGGQTDTTDYTLALFREEYGFEPPQLIDLKALMGDSSDNIPGVPGVGEKTALDLVRRFHSVDTVYARLDTLDIRDSLRKKLAAGEASARLSYELATIDRNAPIDFKLSDAQRPIVYGGALYALFQRLGFRSFLEKWGVSRDVGEAAETENVPAAPDEAVCEDAAAFSAWLEQAQQAEYVAVLPAGEGLDTLCLCDGSQVLTVQRACLGDDWQPLLRRLFSAGIPKVSHDSKDLIRLLLEAGLPADDIVFDTALAAYLLDATESGYELPRISARYLGHECSGAAAVFALYPVLRAQLETLGMQQLYEEIEHPLCRVLAEMELAGFLIDREALRRFGDSLTGSIDALQQSIWALAGTQFNINSPKQLGSVLFDTLLLPAGKKTKTGWSTNADVLERLRGKHPIVQQVLDYRMLTKLKSTYADGLLKVIAPDGRIHSHFRMTVTATGRLSSTEPNLQNIPIRKELGAEIRRMFVPAPGMVLVDADYSQIELRLLAHISGDETMRRAFREGADIHRATAAQVFGVPFEEVTALQRSRAKAVNFGIVYGISAFSLAQDIGVFQSEAKAYMEAYLEKYAGVHAYMKSVVEQARQDGYVSTLFGRRRSLPELKSSNFQQRAFGERVALNMPIQGTAADIIKLAMVNAARRLRAEQLQARLILQVHDELIVESPVQEAEQVAALLKEEMEQAVSLSIPLTVDVKIGSTWAEAH
ncbi:MAG: DNA polymerase I [Clostridiales bacterium]|nr:DNA polymerase I [Clostridiales bacterium]